MTVEALDRRLWGKEKGLSRPYPVIFHLLDTAAIAGVLWDGVLTSSGRERLADRLGVPVEVCRRWLVLWAGLHDIGKITPPFQAMVPAAYNSLTLDSAYAHASKAERERLRHDAAGHWALTEIFGAWGYPASRVGAVHQQVAQLLGGHHGCFHRRLEAKKLRNSEAWVPGLGGPGWAAQRKAHAEAVRRLVCGDMKNGSSCPAPEKPLPAEVAVQYLGLIVVADWLASQEHVIERRLSVDGWQGSDDELLLHWEAARVASPGIVQSAQLGVAHFPARSFDEQFPFPPNDLQASISARLPLLVAPDSAGLLLVTAPTGDGKTEAALHAGSVMARATGASGLYFALPTMATADAMHGRVAEFAEANVDGDKALTLLHSMAWLSESYGLPTAVAAGADASDVVSPTVSDRLTGTAAGHWLRGSKRGLLAPLGAGTIDQALTGVLPVRYNTLRLLGLSSKVLVVDEAHAYGPWMHSLLVRLLEWLGAMGAPVVLLSATLAGRSASSLVEAYRRGCGFTQPSPVKPVYPGWLYVDATTGTVSPAHRVVSGRPRTVRVQSVPVRWDIADEPGLSGPLPGTRGAALVDHLSPVVDDGGCALVCCTTVDEAQRTYRFLERQFPDLAAEAGHLLLLHSRFPAQRRREITERCEALFGKPRAGDAPSQRPQRAILVATQVVEQSLDLDFDVIVSDLAPLAQLLQRAGRCMRHQREGRPGWVGEEPRLVVLEPVQDGRVVPPRTWGTVYDTGLLRRTSQLLRESEPEGIEVPGDVQRLVDSVYAEDFGDRLGDAAAREELQRLDAEREAATMAEEQLARMTMVPSPSGLTDLARLSDTGLGLVDEALVTTRLGADSERAVCVYQQSDGEFTLDPVGRTPLPRGRAGRGPLSVSDVRSIMKQSVPLPRRWLVQRDAEQAVPPSWEERPVLADLAVLRMLRVADAEPGRALSCTIWACRVGDRTLTMSDVGLRLLPDNPYQS